MIDAAISTYGTSILELLRLCVCGDHSKVLAELQQYDDDPDRLLSGIVQQDELVGAAGLWRPYPDQAILLHIAIKPQYQRQGLGTKLIDHLMRHYNIPILEAETDIAAVDFYRRLGFQITSLGEKYPGVERFRCLLNGRVMLGNDIVR